MITKQHHERIMRDKNIVRDAETGALLEIDQSKVLKGLIAAVNTEAKRKKAEAMRRLLTPEYQRMRDQLTADIDGFIKHVRQEKSRLEDALIPALTLGDSAPNMEESSKVVKTAAIPAKPSASPDQGIVLSFIALLK